MDMHSKIAHALDTLRQAEGKSFIQQEKADADVIRLCNTLLAKRGYHNLPEDYAALLSQAAGIMGPYFILLNMGAMALAGGGLQQGIIEESDVFNHGVGNDEAKTMVVGKMSGNAVVIYQDGKYHVVDAATHDVFRTYDDIADFMTDTVQKKDAALRAAT